VLAVILFSPAFGHASSGQEGARLDEASRQCIGCHEGVLSGVMVSHIVASEHPVGVNYQDIAARNPSLVRPGALPPAVKLVGGRISCITCHVAYEEKNHQALAEERRRERTGGGPDPMLRIDNTGSRLCMACHRK